MANERLCRSTHHKNHVNQYKHNEYMAHHYAFMTNVADMCEPKSYAKAAQDAKWRKAMEEEGMLVQNNTYENK